VYRQLRDAILDGSLAPGTSLAGERVLAEQFAVNRHAIREAMRRLEQARLVEVSHGGSTKVLNWRTSAGLELLGELGMEDEFGATMMLRSGLEMRYAIGIDAARLAARRISGEVAAALVSHVERVAASSPVPGYDELAAEYDVLWRMIVAASDNLAYQLADNTLVAALQRFPELALQVSTPEITDLDAQRDLVVAIRDHDEAGAAAAARELLERALISSE
jgi:DNA-binding FadR family transcriptional regulator